MIRAALFAVLLLLGVPAEPEELIGMVVEVTDGDTLTLLDGNQRNRKIRLAGIDALEKGQAFFIEQAQSGVSGASGIVTSEGGIDFRPFEA